MNKLLRQIAKRILDKPEYSVSIKVVNLTENELLKECRALVTGGSRGIGREIALKIVEWGGRVVITGRNETLLKEVSNLHDDISYIVCDIKNLNEYKQLIHKSEELLNGTLNSLVLNAGVSNHEGTIINVSIESFDDQMDTNLKANYFMLKEYAKIINNREREDRSIIVITSETGNMPYDIPYGLTKASLNKLIEGFSHRFYKNLRVESF